MIGKSFNVTLNIKSIAIVIALLIALCWGIYDAFKTAYQNGYNVGYNECNSIVVQERTKWENDIKKIQESHNIEITKLTKDYEHKINELDNNIKQLVDNPVIIEKYIDVPIEIPDKLILLHDRSAKGESLYTMIPKEFTTKNKYNINDLAKKINKNYNTCLRDQARLEALQKVVKDFIKKQQELTK